MVVLLVALRLEDVCGVSGVDGGLAEVIVAPGQQAGICQRLLDGESLGTRLALEAI